MTMTRWCSGMLAVSIVGILGLAWGCLSDVRVYETAASHRAALHGIHGERISSAMKSIGGTYTKAQRLPIRLIKARGFAQLEHCAKEVASFAVTLPEMVNLHEMNADETAVFEKLAGQLKANADALQAAAASSNRAAVRRTFAKLTSTCNACHAAFREHHSGAQLVGG